MVGLVTLIIIPVQLLLIAFAMRGFQQAWSVEVEVPDGQHYQPGMTFEDEGGSDPRRPATA